jgi:hypothetical protein
LLDKVNTPLVQNPDRVVDVFDQKVDTGYFFPGFLGDVGR